MTKISVFSIVVFGIALSLAIPSFPTIAAAVEYHVKENADRKGNGSQSSPWRSIQQALKSGKLRPGDTLFLHPGYYGSLILKKAKNSAPLTITTSTANRARFDRIYISASQNWIIKNLEISGSFATSYKKRKMVDIDKGSRSITLENLDIHSFPDTRSWSKEDWKKKASDGIRSRGEDIKILNNNIRNVGNGITITGSNSVIHHNLVDRFSADGMRGLGNYLTFSSNTVKNCIKVDKNHDDGFQSWSRDKNGKTGRGVVKGIKLIGNRFIASDDPNALTRCTMQGIGLFDGMYEDWIIANNLVVVDHWHGITVMGAKNVRIINNTVVDPDDRKPGPAGIKILDHKKGFPSSGNVVANNIAASFGKNRTRGLYSNNLIIRNPQYEFVDPSTGNFELVPNSAARQSANPLFLPEFDILGRIRAKDKKGDLGAFQDGK